MSNYIIVSDTAYEGIIELAIACGYVRHTSHDRHGVSSFLTACAVHDVPWLDSRPAYIKEGSPLVWSDGSQHRSRGVGAIPLTYLSTVASLHGIRAYRAQNAALLGLNPNRPRAFMLRPDSSTALAGPVCEAIGLGWLTAESLPIKIPVSKVRLDKHSPGW